MKKKAINSINNENHVLICKGGFGHNCSVKNTEFLRDLWRKSFITVPECKNSMYSHDLIS